MVEFDCYIKGSCGPSKQLEAYAKKNLTTPLTIINVDSYPLQVLQLNILATPTIIVKNNNVEIARVVGYSTKLEEELDKFIRKV